jgi:hypothetical protein
MAANPFPSLPAWIAAVAALFRFAIVWQTAIGGKRFMIGGKRAWASLTVTL